MNEENEQETTTPPTDKWLAAACCSTTKNARWFIKKEATTSFTRGFRKLSDASDFIDQIRHLDWRVGYLYKLKGDDSQYSIVNRKGELAVSK